MKKILLLTIIATFLNSCVVDIEVGGCTDPLADNYNASADYHNNTCLYTCVDPYAVNYGITESYDICDYEADVVFYQDVASATYFSILGIDWLGIYVNDVYIDNLLNVGFTYVPLCFPIDPDAVHFTLVWENSITSTFHWSIKDLTGYTHFESFQEPIVANECLPMELTFGKIQEYKEASK